MCAKKLNSQQKDQKTHRKQVPAFDAPSNVDTASSKSRPNNSKKQARTPKSPSKVKLDFEEEKDSLASHENIMLEDASDQFDEQEMLGSEMEDSLPDQEKELTLASLKKGSVLKKPASAYIIFGKEKRKEILLDNPTARVTEVVKEIARCWSQLSKEQRSQYKDAAKKDKERYEIDLKLLQNFAPELKKPKKCLSAYMIFVKETRPQIVEDNPHMGALEVMKQVGIRWQSMNSEERQYFQDKADKDKIRYIREMNTFVKRIEEVAEATPDVLIKDRDKEVSFRKGDSQMSERNSESHDEPSISSRGKGRVRKNDAVHLGKRKSPEESEKPKLQLKEKILFEVPSFHDQDSPFHKAKHDSHRPKKPLSAYIFFSQMYREELKQKNPNSTNQETLKAIGHRWSSMSKKEKAPYEKLSAEDRERYEKEQAEFEKTHKKQESFVKLRDAKANLEIARRKGLATDPRMQKIQEQLGATGKDKDVFAFETKKRRTSSRHGFEPEEPEDDEFFYDNFENPEQKENVEDQGSRKKSFFNLGNSFRMDSAKGRKDSMFVTQENLKSSQFHRKDTSTDLNAEANTSGRKLINVGSNIDMDQMMNTDIFNSSPFLGAPKKSPAFAPLPSPNFAKPSPKIQVITTPTTFLQPAVKKTRKSSKNFSTPNIAGLAQQEMPNLIGDQVDREKMQNYIQKDSDIFVFKD